MKKFILTAVFFLLILHASFSLDLAAGAGISGDFIFNTLAAEVNGGDYTQKYSQLAIGGLLFFDAQYVEADLRFYGTSTQFKHNPKLAEWGTHVDQDWLLGGVGLGLGLFGKYPFILTNEFTIFPLLGVQFDLQLSQNYMKDYTPYDGTKKGDSYGKAFDWSAITFKAGVGADYSISDSLFIRGELLFNFKLNSNMEMSYIKAIKNSTNEIPTNLNMGFGIKLAVGYRLGSVSTSFGGGSRTTRQPREPAGDDIYYPVQ
ncbi:hypothetical protein AGMMS50212_00830 [Spirochaetia bacterium]|nr:hypothetical protein AGMMS50212_00830 [Spirochaetia bacterium]